MASASRSIEIAVPAAAFQRVVEDYARYPEFLPEVKSVKVDLRAAGLVEVTYWLDVKLKVVDFTLLHEVKSPGRIEWRLVRGGEIMRRNHGAWTLERTDSGQTRATYAIEIELSPLVPQILEKALAERGLPNLLSNFRTRAEQLARK